jgi:hypothetical protein
MKFRYGQNQTIIQTIKNKQTGHTNRYAICKFDDKGELETNDPKLIFILKNKVVGCTWDKEDEVIVEADEVKDILSDDDIRQLAKSKGIKHWHNKKIDRLKKELEELEV